MSCEYEWQRNRATAFHAPIGSSKRFLSRLPELLEHRHWALTLQAGASLIAPHASWELIHVYVEHEREEDRSSIGEAVGWTPAPEGKVVLMTPFFRTSVWRGHASRGVSYPPSVTGLWHVLEHLFHTEQTVTRLLDSFVEQADVRPSDDSFSLSAFARHLDGLTPYP